MKRTDNLSEESNLNLKATGPFGIYIVTVTSAGVTLDGGWKEFRGREANEGLVSRNPY